MISCTADSGTLIDANRRNPEARAALAKFADIGLSHVVLGELLAGVLKASHQQELSKTLALITGMTLLHGDARTAIIYSQIRRRLEQKGTMIPQNDIWIASASLQAEVPLITRDAHFAHVDGLRVITY